MRGWLAAEKLPNWHHFFIRDSGQKINKAPDGISSYEYLLYKQSIRVIQLFLFSMIVIHSYIHDIHSNCTGSHADPQGECSMTNSD